MVQHDCLAGSNTPERISQRHHKLVALVSAVISNMLYPCHGRDGVTVRAHLGVAVSDLPYPCETFGPLRYAQDIINPSVRIENGLLYPPEGGGLGVTLDWAVVNEWRVEE